jgi:hypothetical protein
MQALREDPAKMAALEKEPEVGKIVLGDDIHAFNELMKSVYEVNTAPRRPLVKSSAIAACTLSQPDSCDLSKRCTVLPSQAEKKRSERMNKRMAERTIDAQRVSATLPRRV